MEGALKGAMLDLTDRMQDINTALSGETPTTEEASASLEDKEQLLDELMELVENIDQAKDLSTIGGLPTLLSLLSCPHPSLQWRAAEVIATCAQNNPEVQDGFLQGGVLPAVWPLLDHPNITCIIKGLLALSCQVRGHAPSLQWFRDQHGVDKLIKLLDNEDKRVQRKCLQMLEYILRRVPGDRQEVCCPLLPLLTGIVAESEDGDVRESALAVMQRLAGDNACLREMQKDGSLMAAVQALQGQLDTIPQEDWGSAEDEARLAVALMGDLTKVVPEDSTVAGSPAEIGSTVGSSMQLMALPSE